MRVALVALLFLAGVSAGGAAPRAVQVFVALCDNDSQGIAPVNERIGDGDKPAANLYWGCSDGLASYFGRSSRWKLLKTERDVTPEILVRLHFRHVAEELTLTADAYRGTALRSCLRAFEKALVADEYQVVAFLGHNGLMDFALDPPARSAKKQPEAIVLCCKSEAYFRKRLEGLGARPILLTDQYMYPGAFLLHDALEAWRSGHGRTEIRAAAGRAYAKNQKIGVRSATGVFTKLPEK